MRRTRPPTGTIRIKKWFAFLPVAIGSDVRQFEFVVVKQEYHPWRTSSGGFWQNMDFISEDNPEYYLRGIIADSGHRPLKRWDKNEHIKST